MTASRSNPGTADGHALLAERLFDGRGWRTEAAVLIRDGRIAAIESPGAVPPDWPTTRLPPGIFLAEPLRSLERLGIEIHMAVVGVGTLALAGIDDAAHDYLLRYSAASLGTDLGGKSSAR